MKLSYNPETHRYCHVCEAKGGQYPLRRIIPGSEAWFFNGAPTLECGHIAMTLARFREENPEWRWDGSDQGEHPLLDLVLTRQLAAAVRRLHSPRLYTDIDAHVCVKVCAECRQDWPCATERAMLASGSLQEPSSG